MPFQDRLPLRSAARVLAFAAAASFARSADAQDGPAPESPPKSATAVAESKPGEVTPPQALPSYLAGKQKMSDRDLKDKVEGAYFTGLPLLDSDPDAGFGFGARVYRYWNGDRTDPLFEYTPYRHRVFLQAFATTNGFHAHGIDYDAPNIGGSPFRLRADLFYIRNKAANYFGRGDSTLHDLSFSGAAGSFSKFKDYTAALRQVNAQNVAYTLYDKYDAETPILQATIEDSLFGGLVRVQAGLIGSYATIRDFTGTGTTGDNSVTGQKDVAATEAMTRLREDCNAERIVGCSGGIHNRLKLGIAFDTRDYEPDPNSGIFADITTEISHHALLSDFDYIRGTAAVRGFYSPFPNFTDLVIAGRAVYSVQSGGVPFFAMQTLDFTDGNRDGLGGLYTIRGYKQDRFVGNVAAFANAELRWTFVKFDALKQNFSFAIVPFIDVGRVFNSVGAFTFKNWKNGEGAALRIGWNQATIISADFGVSREDAALYIDFGHQF